MYKASRCIILVAVLLPAMTVCDTAFGWLGPTHSALCQQTFDDPVVSPLLGGFNGSVYAVETYLGEPPGNWHDMQWLDIRDRAYVEIVGRTPPHGNDYFSIDPTTRLKYLMHNATDVGVPLGHSPAGEMPDGYVDEGLENYWEIRTALWFSRPDVVGTTFFTNSGNGHFYDLDGTIGQIVDKFYDACRDNMNYLKNGGDGKEAFWSGMTLALILQRAVAVDYLLSQQDMYMDLDGCMIIKRGGTAHFDASQCYDPDDIVWHSNGTYSHTGNNLQEYCWDFNNDLIWDWVDDDPCVDLTYDQLRANGVQTDRWVHYFLRVKDDEGKYGYEEDWLYLTSDGSIIVPEPATMSLLTIGGLALLRRRSR